MHRRKLKLSVAFIAASILCTQAFAQDDEIAALKKQLAQLQAQINAITARQQETKAVVSSAEPSATSSQPAKFFAFSDAPDAQEKSALAAVMGASSAKNSNIPLFQVYDSPNTRLGLYGIVDATLNSISNGSGRQTGLDVSWMSGNRWGITGSHNIGNNLDVIFRLESEFELPTGNMDTPNVLFNRDAWLGLYGQDVGKITVGRQNTLGRDFVQNWANPFGSADTNLTENGWNNNAAMQYMIWYGGGARGTRQDSAIVWKKDYGPWVVGLSNAFGSLSGAGDNSNVGPGGTDSPSHFWWGSTQAAGLAYNADTWHASGIYTRANVAGQIHQVAGIGGNIISGPLTWMGGYFHYTAGQGTLGKRTDNVFTAAVKWAPKGKFDYELGYYHVQAHNAGGGTAFNPFHDTTGFAPGSAIDGSRQTLYAAAFYRIDKVTDLYVAADVQRLGGGVTDFKFNNNNLPATTSKTATEFGVGARYKF